MAKACDECHTNRTFYASTPIRRCGHVKFNWIFFLIEDRGREMLLIPTGFTVSELSNDHLCK